MNAAAVADDVVRQAGSRASARAHAALATAGDGDLQQVVDLVRSVCDAHAAAIGVQAVSYTHLTLPTIYSV